MTSPLIDPGDTPERQAAKLLKITEALMGRVERATDDSGEAYAHFQRASLLEEQVQERTRDLEHALDLLNRSNARLSQAMRETEQARADLVDALESVREGFALFDANDVLVKYNGRFGAALPDIAPHLRAGLRFSAYAKHCARSRHLVLPKGTSPATWLRQRLRDHRRQSVNFNVGIVGGRWMQVSEQRTPGNGTAIIQTDITDLIQMERQERDKLLDQQALLIRATLDHIAQGICIFDARHRLVGWNSRLRELLSPPMQLMRVGTSFDALAENFQHTLVFRGTQGPERLLGWVRSGDGRPPLKLDLSTRDGTFLHVFGQEMPQGGLVISFSDVTGERTAATRLRSANESLEERVAERTLALKEALEEAERANASKTRFVAAASHDLLQPLSAAKLFLATAESVGDPGDRTLSIRQARSALGSVEGILGALLDISRLDSGMASVTLSTFPLRRVLDTLGQEFGHMARRKGLDLRVVPTSAVVRSDAFYLRRIVQNLLANAVRYTSSGKVLLGVRRIGGAVRIEVWDTGPGIPELSRETIFQEFHRLETPKCADDGMGLGLTIVERACSLLGHRLELVSDPGRGTGFSVEVPRVGEVRQVAEDRTRSIEGASGQLTGLVALVVGNDDADRLAVCALLESWGVGVLDVRGGGDALSLLEDIGIAPDVILADYDLEGRDHGIQVIAAIRERYGPIQAFLTASSRCATLPRRCEDAGAVLLKKPIEPARLRAIMVGILPLVT